MTSSEVPASRISLRAAVDVVDHPWGQAEGELVDDEQLRRDGKDAGQGEHALFAARERARELAAPVGEAGKTREGVGEGFGGRLAAEGADEGEAEVVLDVESGEH